MVWNNVSNNDLSKIVLGKVIHSKVLSPYIEFSFSFIEQNNVKLATY